MTYREEGYCDICGSYFQSNAVETICPACNRLINIPIKELIKDYLQVKSELIKLKMSSISRDNREVTYDQLHKPMDI